MILGSQSISCPLWTQVWLILQAEKGKVILLFGLGRRVVVGEGGSGVPWQVTMATEAWGLPRLSRVWRQSSGALAFVSKSLSSLLATTWMSENVIMRGNQGDFEML